MTPEIKGALVAIPGCNPVCPSTLLILLTLFVICAQPFVLQRKEWCPMWFSNLQTFAVKGITYRVPPLEFLVIWGTPFDPLF